MMVWFTPAMIDGSALGNWIFHSSCASVLPNKRPASNSSSRTWRMPSGTPMIRLNTVTAITSASVDTVCAHRPM